ncbi:Molecular chaperone IbpA, HSP20 family [Desulfatibacillum alkenivorans DSM 16219]|jgi:HSP20 family molecular chaperone IbpA|uniref:Molecular chaperone IbpA, HSP20 family n=1 Tax=Desulfatibacillum alkenivorans DSM 16219 TaxID=1121393 RepID=A0A1M6GLR6_9BACT|nr:Hsp20/alpha crystallin family protein [Desulfatibacillum alkenivorans]SHJ10884.1 Molecular chaperone IbpA, HSP20 family [Desulfatibacillum alkenivorans DSM 16219]
MELEKKYTVAKIGVLALLAVCVLLGAALLKDKDEPIRIDDLSAPAMPKGLESFSKSFSKEFKQGQDQAFDMLDKFFDEGFFKDNSDPFQKMEQMRRDIHKKLEKGLQGSFDDSWDDWYDARFTGHDSFSMSMEDKAHAYEYKISIPNRSSQDLKVDVTKDGIQISGTLNKVVEKKNADGEVTARQEVASTVSQRFSLPDDANYGSAKITNGDDQIIITVPKV